MARIDKGSALDLSSQCNVCHKRGVEMARERQEEQTEHKRRGAFRLDVRSTRRDSSGTSGRQNVKISARISGLHFPFRALPVWHSIKFRRSDPVTGQLSTADSIYARPARRDKQNVHKIHPSRFDTALINDGTGKDYGVKGYRVGRIRVIFSIPNRYHQMLFKVNVSVPQHLAYVELFTKLDTPDPNHGMFKISPWKDQDGGRICSIIPIANICRSVHLLPKFGPIAPPEWTTSNILDLCPTFFVNIYTDRHLFRTLFDTEA